MQSSRRFWMNTSLKRYCWTTAGASTRGRRFCVFQTNRDIATRTEFLKNSYNDIWVEVLAGVDKIRVGYHAQQDGLLMWEGSYLSRASESVFHGAWLRK